MVRREKEEEEKGEKGEGDRPSGGIRERERKRESERHVLICIVFIGSPIEAAVNLLGFTFQGYPLNLDTCK
jgi:hypothetical protein